jgi:hypothetical protein
MPNKPVIVGMLKVLRYFRRQKHAEDIDLDSIYCLTILLQLVATILEKVLEFLPVNHKLGTLPQPNYMDNFSKCLFLQDTDNLKN